MPKRTGWTFPLSDRDARDLSHARPSWAAFSLTEGDLLIGTDCRSAVGTLVERTTRYVMLLHLPDGRDASAWNGRCGSDQHLRRELRRTVTWDQGKEMAHHAHSRSPPHPGLLLRPPQALAARLEREHQRAPAPDMPKGTDLSIHTAEDLALYARSLNDRPRKTLGYLKPSERLAEILAHTG